MCGKSSRILLKRLCEFLAFLFPSKGVYELEINNLSYVLVAVIPDHK